MTDYAVHRERVGARISALIQQMAHFSWSRAALRRPGVFNKAPFIITDDEPVQQLANLLAAAGLQTNVTEHLPLPWLGLGPQT